jgi:hypothetical protein
VVVLVVVVEVVAVAMPTSIQRDESTMMAMARVVQHNGGIRRRPNQPSSRTDGPQTPLRRPSCTQRAVVLVAAAGTRNGQPTSFHRRTVSKLLRRDSSMSLMSQGDPGNVA